MKSKVLPVVFSIIAVALAGTFIVTRIIRNNREDTVTRAKVVSPKAADSAGEADETVGKLSALEAEKYETFVPLHSNETLINTLTIDFNNDGYDDEVVLAKRSGSPHLFIIPGVYNSENGNYERRPELKTDFSSTRTFSYSGMDIIGDHRTALIYQGIADDGNYVMKIFLWQKTEKNENGALTEIGDFSSDGTVFVQQTERSDNYELGISKKGESYSVWVYKTDIPENLSQEEKAKLPSNLNQIQQEYKWNESTQHYELAREIKVTAGRLAATELSRIQDGTVETFADYLNGLWYKTSNADGNIRYVYFNYAKKEIIQLVGEIQEVYEWENSKIRHNGIYLTTVNADIMNLHRRFDVSLLGVDEIRISCRDAINLLIKESPLWDGQYKKMSIQSSFADKSKISTIDEFSKTLQKKSGWQSVDTLSSISFDDFTYTLQSNEITESGVYVLSKIGTYNVVQFRSDSEHSFLSEYYSMEFGQKTVTETIKRKTVEKVVTDYDTIIFTPVKITPTDCFTVEGRVLTFVR